ncbi:hypothetical protein E8E11_008070 [Didymella keratinophila]|nr:hypothetical protein E8E11_008070 [Didymella keratinophila]
MMERSSKEMRQKGRRFDVKFVVSPTSGRALDWCRRTGETEEWTEAPELNQNCDDWTEPSHAMPIAPILTHDEPSAMQLRVPIYQVIAFLEEELKEVIPPLKAIMEAHDPPLSVEQAWALMMKGQTKEQRKIGVPRYIGGVKIDGSTHFVEIL